MGLIGHNGLEIDHYKVIVSIISRQQWSYFGERSRSYQENRLAIKRRLAM